MDAPDIGAKLLKNFRTDSKEPLRILRHQGWSNVDGTDQDLGYIEEEMPPPHAFVPVPPNQQIDPQLTADELRDARWLWALVPLSPGVDGPLADRRAPDRVRRVSTGELYRYAQGPDVASLQSGLAGGLLLRLRP